MNALQIIIDGKTCEAKSGETVLAAAERNGFEIPTLCFLKDTKPYTSCFLCVVEVKGRKTLAPACSTEVSDKMEVTTKSERIRESRKACLELLLSDHCGDCLAPCQASCPAGLDIPGFIHLLLDEKPAAALKLIKDTIPLPASLGRVCPRPCEEACRRKILDSSVSICFLKRFVADEDISAKKRYVPSTAPATDKKVAIIGGGPAGLSAAFYLRQAGHGVTVFDAHPKSGGMLRYGIPAYRLPRNILDEEISVIKDMGVEFKQNSRYGTDFDLKSLRSEGFDSIFIAVGAQASSNMGISGEDEGGALSGIEFLEDVSLGADVQVGEKVVVVGGGNTAIDAARTSVRLGAKEVAILYRRTRNEMPANEIEVLEGEREGVLFQYLAAPVSMQQTSTGIDLLCIKMELGEPDSTGRRRPVPIKGSEFVLHASTVISAIGQKVDTTDYEMKNFELTKWGTMDVNPRTFETSVQGVYAGGDCVSGADIAVRAVATGKKAALSINQHLKGEHVIGVPVDFDSKMGDVEDVPREIFEGKEKLDRAKMPELKINDRIKNFHEVETGLSYEVALEEAKRCLACGCSTAKDCKTRKYCTEYGVEQAKYRGARKAYYVDDSHPTILFESHKCILCCNCVRYFEEIKGQPILGLVKRGFETVVRPPLGKKLYDVLKSTDTKWVELCPTGAFSTKGRFESYC